MLHIMLKHAVYVMSYCAFILKIWKPLFVADYGSGQTCNVASLLIMSHGYMPATSAFNMLTVMYHKLRSNTQHYLFHI
jgi:hypothetical protein